MRTLSLVALSLVACTAETPKKREVTPTPVVTPTTGPVAPMVEKMAADTPRTTVAGHTFVAPAEWSVRVDGPATILTVPEGGSHVALIDVQAADADAAVAAAWQAYRKESVWPLKVVHPLPDRDGWTARAVYDYQTSPNERRAVDVQVGKAGDGWSVVISDVEHGVGDRRGAQLAAIFDRLLPKGHTRESFAGKSAHELDAARIAALTKFVEDGQKATKVPGVSIGLIEAGKVVFSGGFGVRALGEPERVDGQTKYSVASNTKAMTTLMLARLVDAGKLTWETAATSLLPSFKLGDADTTSRVQVKHLICACTGMPRQDLEWLLDFGGKTPEGAMTLLGTMQPTSPFGALFQYSNPLAAAAGYIGGHVLYPDLELGAAYDKAMQTQVFDPLGMTATTFDFKKGQSGNFAAPHSLDLEGNQARALAEINTMVIPVRPAGGAWSSVDDMLKYVAMELAEGALPDGSRYIGKEALLARRAPQVALGNDGSYGMGLMIDRTYGVEVVHHGGDLIGFHSDMMWLPEHGVGAVVLTNGDPGWLLRGEFKRKLLEVLFDGQPEADARVAAGSESFFAGRAAERKLMTAPAEVKDGELMGRYVSEALGEIVVKREAGGTVFDVGEWQTPVASRTNPDGSRSFVSTATGMFGLEFVVGPRTLTLRDAQHEYVFSAR